MTGMLALTLAAAASLQAPAQAPATTPEARAAMHAFGQCVADASPEFAAETLAMDFTSRAYRSRLRQLATNNAPCLGEGRMRAGNLAFAGAVAERLLERDPQPLNARLARAAQGPAAPTYSPTDSVAMCVVRSVPDDVARLFATEVGDGAEIAAAQALEPVMGACNQTDRRVETSTAGLRSMLATAAYRALHGTREPNRTED